MIRQEWRNERSNVELINVRFAPSIDSAMKRYLDIIESIFCVKRAAKS
jgi:hypothetical protein